VNVEAAGAVLGGVLGGRWRVDAIVGQGAFGRVFRALDLESGETVALKEFIRQRGQSDSFLRELGMLFELKHPHIIECSSLHLAGAFRYIVCEFMEGGSLRDLLRARATPTRALLELLQQVCEGVAYAHSRNIIHRDLKPENILLRHVGDSLIAKVSDFGISTLDTSNGEHSAIGSPAYMAPEQFYGQYDARVDVYALGVILYEIVCGRRPFHGSAAQLMLAHMRSEPEWPCWIPSLTLRVLKKSLAKKPAKRFSTVSAFLEALQLALDVESEALVDSAFPFEVRDSLAIASSEHDLLVRCDEAVLRFDPHGRLIRTEPPADRILGSPGAVVALRGGTAYVRTANVTRRLVGIPTTEVALATDGSLAFVRDGSATIINSLGHPVAIPCSDPVASIAFVGVEQSPAIASNHAAAATLRFAGQTIALPSPIRCLYGHSKRWEVIARSSVDPTLLFLVSVNAVRSVRVQCGDFACDGDSIFSTTPDGALLSINVASGRVARTRWSAPLASLTCSGTRLLWLTHNHQLQSLS